MDKEVLERLEKIQEDIIKSKKQFLTELAVHDNKVNSTISSLKLQIQVLTNSVDKYFDYENYFDKLDNL